MDSETATAKPPMPPDSAALLETWRKRVEKELAAATPAPAFETLRTPLAEGFALEPLYVSAPHAGHVAAANAVLAAGDGGADEGALIDLRAHAAGHAAEQLAAALVALVALTSPGKVVVRVPVGAEILREIAKLRALRRLAARVYELTSEAAQTVVVHAFAWRATPAADVASNLIGNSASVFAAVTGGADRVTPLAHSDAPEHQRLADNVARLALYEAHLADVRDPAAGSYALESITEGLCQAAWSLFQGAMKDAVPAGEVGR